MVDSNKLKGRIIIIKDSSNYRIAEGNKTKDFT
jgi:hypothetical protein